MTILVMDIQNLVNWESEVNVSNLQNDMIMESIADEIWGKVENGDFDTHQKMSEIGFEKGLHCDDDMEEIVEIMIEEAWENYPDGPIN